MATGQTPTFGELLKRYRMAAGLSQQQLAELASLSTRAVSALEQGTRQAPQRETVCLLATALSLTEQERTAFAASVSRRRKLPPSSTINLASNLPAQPTPLIGREQEVAAIVTLLLREEARLVTLTGPGGVGKTRLGVQVAAEVSDIFVDGAYYIPLASVGDPVFVVSTIARSLGLKESGSRPLSETLIEYLRDRSVLLLLDNFEHVLTAATGIADLLSTCPKLTVLVTSRAVLHIRAEYEFAVPPLAVPDVVATPHTEALYHYAAVRLFVQRARAVKQDFYLTDANASAVARICVRLDGLPLAIELAAARIKLLSPEALLARLHQRLQTLTDGSRDLPERLRTMRDAIAWSYDFLDAGEQVLFARLSVFVGGCTATAAEVVCGATHDPATPVFAGLASLVGQSLLQVSGQDDGESRFGMLEIIREYGQERLMASEEMEEIRRRHAAYYMALAEEAEPELQGPDQALWIERIEQEHNNLRAALQWALDSGAQATGLRLAGAVWRFWYKRGYVSEGQEWLEGLLASAANGNEQPSASVYIKALHGAGVLAVLQSKYDQATLLYERGLALARQQDDKQSLAEMLHSLGRVAHDQYNYERAIGLYEESLCLRRTIGDKKGIANTLTNLGIVAHEQGNYAKAAVLYEEGLALYRELGDKRSVGICLGNLGLALSDQGEWARGAVLIEENLRLQRELNDKVSIGHALINLGCVALLQGEYERAATLAEESFALQQELGDKRNMASSLLNWGEALRNMGDYERAKAIHKESLALARDVNNGLGIAECLEELADITSLQGCPNEAARLFGAAATLRDAMETPISPAERTNYDRAVAATKSAMGDDEFVAAWTAGMRMPIEQVIAELL